jgi:mersacidin/lichenicidin family type 2 lantibiotic
MSHVNVIRAWKDEEYRLGLPEADRARLPENPAGLIEVPEHDLGAVAGGYSYLTNYTCYSFVWTQPCLCYPRPE